MSLNREVCFVIGQQLVDIGLDEKTNNKHELITRLWGLKTVNTHKKHTWYPYVRTLDVFDSYIG